MDYVSVTDVQIFTGKILRILMIVDPLLIIFSLAVMLFRPIRRPHNLLLSAFAAIFWNIGTVVWTMRS